MEYVKHLLSQGQVKEALEMLHVLDPKNDDIIMLQSNLENLEETSRLGLITEEERLKQFNNITYKIVDNIIE